MGRICPESDGATIRALPEDLLREGVYCFSALSRENEGLRAENQRLRALVSKPYADAVERLVYGAAREQDASRG